MTSAYIYMLVTNFYTKFSSDSAAYTAGNGAYIDYVPELITKIGSWFYYSEMEMAIILFVGALICALIAMAWSKKEKRPERKNYIVKVATVMVLVFAFGSFVCMVAGIGDNLITTDPTYNGMPSSVMDQTQR